MASLTAPAPASTSAERSYLDHGAPWWRRVLLTREMAIIALLLAVIIVASAVLPKFATPITLGFLLLDVTPILLIALPMTCVIITGEIDLSVGSMVGLGSVLFGIMHQAGLSIPVAALIAVLAGVVGGSSKSATCRSKLAQAPLSEARRSSSVRIALASSSGVGLL